MPTYYLRNTTEQPSLVKRLLARLPLAAKRHALYLRTYRRIGDFRTPRLFSEKMQWRIINDRREMLRPTCDKRAMNSIVERLAKDEALPLRVPNIFAWSSDPKQLIADLRKLQEQAALPTRWVLKPNHSSGRALVVVGEPDWDLIESAAYAWMAPSRFTGLHWIWPYATAEQGLLAVEFIPSATTPLEWSIWVIDGVIKYVVVQQRELDQRRRACFDAEWQEVESWYNSHATPLPLSIRPHNWEMLRSTALRLADGWDLLRVDLYEDSAGELWFGELTPYPHEGFAPSHPGGRRFDESVGKSWALPDLGSVGNER